MGHICPNLRLNLPIVANSVFFLLCNRYGSNMTHLQKSCSVEFENGSNMTHLRFHF
jgi:hypothetical protein